MRGKIRHIEIVEYDPAWPRTFEALRAVVVRALGDLALTVEHVGSTSVPGLAAKPIIDMDVVIASRDQLPHMFERLRALGYVHQGDLDIAGREAFGREAFGREGEDVPRDGSAGRTFWPTHNLYVCAQNNRELGRHLAFRNYLRAHPDEAYEDLKRDLARRHQGDIDTYSRAKTKFVEGILQKAFVP